MANLRVKQKQQTRRHLLTHALRLFQEKGYVATTIDDIASAVGTTRVTFYAHFPNKGELMRALIDELNEILDRHESDVHGSTAIGLVEAVRVGTFDAIHAWITARAAQWPEIKPYITVATEAAAADPEIRPLITGWFDQVTDDLVDGMTLAERHDPETRAFRGYLAIEALNSTNLRWIRQAWPLRDSPELAILAQIWVDLVGDR